MKLTTMRPTNRPTMRKRTVKLWRLQDDGRKLCAGTGWLSSRARRHVGRVPCDG